MSISCVAEADSEIKIKIQDAKILKFYGIK